MALTLNFGHHTFSSRTLPHGFVSTKALFSQSGVEERGNCLRVREPLFSCAFTLSCICSQLTLQYLCGVSFYARGVCYPSVTALAYCAYAAKKL